MQEKLARIDIITENIMVQLIHTLSENGYDIGDEKFILDIGFLSEVIKGAMARQEKLPHIIQGLIDNLMTPDKTRNEDGVDLHYSKFDAPLLADLVEMAEEISEDTEISFEPDAELETDPDKISEWKDDKKSGSLHEMRSKKIHDKKDDEDEDKD